MGGLVCYRPSRHVEYHGTVVSDCPYLAAEVEEKLAELEGLHGHHDDRQTDRQAGRQAGQSHGHGGKQEKSTRGN